jgi:hypothetical protein
MNASPDTSPDNLSPARNDEVALRLELSPFETWEEINNFGEFENRYITNIAVAKIKNSLTIRNAYLCSIKNVAFLWVGFDIAMGCDFNSGRN